MALTLIVEDGTGLANANSYATAAEGTTYHETRLHNDDWDDADAPDREASLVWATRILDEECDWLGTAMTTTQALGWPRAGVYNREGVAFSHTAIPAWLRNATCELGRLLIHEDRVAKAESFAVTQKTVGRLSISYAAFGRARILAESVLSQVREYCRTKRVVRG